MVDYRKLCINVPATGAGITGHLAYEIEKTLPFGRNLQGRDVNKTGAIKLNRASHLESDECP
jgi:hypothetical protein